MLWGPLSLIRHFVQSSNSATLQRQCDVLALLPFVVPPLGVSAAMALFEHLLTLVPVARLGALALHVFCAFFEKTEAQVPPRLAHSVHAVVGRLPPSGVALHLHGALLRHLKTAEARASLQGE